MTKSKFVRPCKESDSLRVSSAVRAFLEDLSEGTTVQAVLVAKTKVSVHRFVSGERIIKDEKCK